MHWEGRNLWFIPAGLVKDPKKPRERGRIKKPERYGHVKERNGSFLLVDDTGQKRNEIGTKGSLREAKRALIDYFKRVHREKIS